MMASWSCLGPLKTSLRPSERHLEDVALEVLVKRSPSCKFRYFDMAKNSGNFSFEKPLEELKLTFGEFTAQSEEIYISGSSERMPLEP